MSISNFGLFVIKIFDYNTCNIVVLYIILSNIFNTVTCCVLNAMFNNSVIKIMPLHIEINCHLYLPF